MVIPSGEIFTTRSALRVASRPRPTTLRGQALRGNDAQTEVLRLSHSFSGAARSVVRAANQNPPDSLDRSPCPPLRVTSDECPVTGKTDSSAGQARENPPQSADHDRCPARDRFEIENLIENLVERLEKFTTGHETPKLSVTNEAKRLLKTKEIIL